MMERASRGTGRFLYPGLRCDCGAVWITAVDRCPECGSWSLADAPIEAVGELTARTTTTDESGRRRDFGLVDLDCGLRVIGLLDADLVVGSQVIAEGDESGVPVFVSTPAARAAS